MQPLRACDAARAPLRHAKALAARELQAGSAVPVANICLAPGHYSQFARSAVIAAALPVACKAGVAVRALRAQPQHLYHSSKQINAVAGGCVGDTEGFVLMCRPLNMVVA